MNHSPSSEESSFNPWVPPTAIASDTDAFQTPTEQLEFKPFRTIWFQPRRTVRQIVMRDPLYFVVPIVALSGVKTALDRASNREMGEHLPLLGILLLAVTLGPLLGIVSLWIQSLLIRWTGSWINGTASAQQLRAAIAWAAVPATFAIVLWIPQIALLGQGMFDTSALAAGLSNEVYYAFLGMVAIESIFGIWSFVLLCNTVAEVQGFHSAWKGLGNLLLAGLVVLFIVLLMLLPLLLLT